MQQTILTILLLLLTSTTTDAHSVIAESIPPNKVRFCYDDRSPMSNTVVTVYDIDGKEIASSTADADGVFDWSTYKGSVKIAAEDHYGHRGEYDIDRPTSGPHRGAVGAVWMIAAVIVATVYYFRRQQFRSVQN